MSDEPTFLSVNDIIKINRWQVDQTDEPHGVRDSDLLLSAAHQPKQTVFGEFAYSDLFGMASAYAFFLAKNHPFEQGNKRTAVHAATLFLYANGYKVKESYAGELADWIYDIVNNRVRREEFAEHLADCSIPLNPDGSEAN